MAKKCLILGGKGFIGQALSSRLAMEGYRVRVFDRPNLAPTVKLDQAGVEFFGGDFLNREDVAHALEDCEVIFHLLSTTLPQGSNDNPLYDIETNLAGTVQLLELARDRGVSKILFASSGGTVYGLPQQVPMPESHPTDPICAYGIGKLAIEKFLHLYWSLHQLDYCVLRVANAYGEGQSPLRPQGAVAVFSYKALRNEPIEIWGDGTVVRDYIHVEDIANAFVAALERSDQACVFNIGSGKGLSLKELLATLETALGRTVKRSYIAGRKFDTSANVLDIHKAQTELAWTPTISLPSGLMRVTEWITKNYL